MKSQGRRGENQESAEKGREKPGGGAVVSIAADLLAASH
jgi:hypothetical protein